ncbi:long-chain specific acyl-CoA dehydrogenase, mitochondrial, partial [Tachysurus ichikawai]
WEKAGEVSREVWEKAGLQGLLGIYTPAEHGGIGGDLLSAAIMWEEQMYSNCSGPGFSLHSEIVMPYISHYGSQAQIERYVPQMAAGKCIGAIAMSEPGAGRMQHSQQDRSAPFRPETSMAKTLMDIGARRIFSEEHDLFRHNVRRFFKEEVVPYHRE